MKCFLATLIIMITLPLVAQAEVRINEIAWMGVAATNGHYGEWLELYNTGSEPVNLSGWKLYKALGTKLIYTFSGTIASHGYHVVERTTASMVDPVPGVTDESGAFSNNGLANTGEDLVLTDASGVVMQTLRYSTGWPAGDSTKKYTMQYAGGEWITAVATPGAVNATGSVVDTGIENEQEDGDQASAPDELDESPVTEKGTLGALLTEEALAEKIPFLQRVKKDPHISFLFPGVVYKGSPYDFGATIALEYSVPVTGVFVWNMGDGTVLRLTQATAVRHSYVRSGVYTVVLSYYQNETSTHPVIWASKAVEVVDPIVTIARIDEGTLEIQNTLDTSITISRWVLSTGSHSAALPDMTILAPGAKIALSTRSLGIMLGEEVTLSTMNGTFVASTQKDVSPRPSLRTGVKVLGVATKAAPSESTTVDGDIPVVVLEETVVPSRQHERTRTVVVGASIVVAVLLLVFLERFIVRHPPE